MLLLGNVLLAVMWLLGIMPSIVVGQSRPEDASSLDAPLLDRAHARQAHRLVEQWLEQGEVPASREARIRVTGLSGVRVTLWRDGVSHGAGEAYVADLAAVTDAVGPVVDLAPLLAEATRQAFDGVRATLDEAQLRAKLDGLDLEVNGPAGGSVPMAGDLLVSVQLAGPLQSIRLHDAAAINALYAHFAPGAHGLRVVASDAPQRSAVLWPASTIEQNISPRGQFTHLLSATGHDPTAISDLARRDGPRLARFEAVHVVRPRRNWAVEELVRGAVLLPQTQIDEATLNDVINRLSEHLDRRFTGDGLVRGTYMPTSNRFDPVVAEPAEAALAAYALTRHAGHLLAMGDEAAGEAQLARALTAVHRLGAWVLAGADGAEPGAARASASLALLSLVDAPTRTGEQREMRDRLGAWLLARATDDGAAGAPADDDAADDTADDAGDATSSDAAARALTVAALAALYEQQRDDALASVVAALMHEQGQAQPNVASLGWRLFAHHRADRLLPEGPAAGQRREAARSLGGLGERFMRRQVRRAPELGPADVVGGFELNRVSPEAPPNPDWRTAHVLAYQALALRTPGVLAEDEAMDWLLSAGLAARFLAQLIVDEPATYSLRSSADAMGGVRLAPWNNHLTVSAQAMTLLAMLELQTALEHLAERGM